MRHYVSRCGYDDADDHSIAALTSRVVPPHLLQKANASSLRSGFITVLFQQ